MLKCISSCIIIVATKLQIIQKLLIGKVRYDVGYYQDNFLVTASTYEFVAVLYSNTDRRRASIRAIIKKERKRRYVYSWKDGSINLYVSVIYQFNVCALLL